MRVTLTFNLPDGKPYPKWLTTMMQMGAVVGGRITTSDKLRKAPK